jgi:E3 ubiquitin-protein ligase UBR4
MVDGVGVCTICARVCHAGHDVTYSKHGSFFCDCGAKDDGSCIALVKRTASSLEERRATASYNAYDGASTSLLRRRASSPIQATNKTTEKESAARDQVTDESILKRRQKLSKKLSGWKEVLSDEIGHSGVASNLLELFRSLLPAIEIQAERQSSLGRLSRLQDALKLLHVAEKTTELTDQLMLPTLGSQEGAFENVRMSYSGDQGQSIRQLVTTHMIRRVVMCCLSSGGSGKRQHLAVAHEKGKITMLQLSALLKQADSSQKKLTLTRLSSAPVPFTVLSVVSNPCNEDYLAVTGLKDCHVLAFNSNGSVADHLVLHPQLDAHNYIVKAVWMAGSQVLHFYSSVVLSLFFLLTYLPITTKDY